MAEPDKKTMLQTDMQLAPGWLLYLYGEKSFICESGNQYNRAELNEIEYDVVDAINRLHLMSDVWAFIKEEYSIEDGNEEAEEVFWSYVENLIDSKMINEGSKTRRVYGERGKCFPLYVSIELTDRCNFKCRHCYKEAESSNSTFIDADKLIDFINYLGKNPYSLELTGGEATLHPDFSRIVRSFPDKTFSLLTNGSMLARLPEDVLKKLLHLQITVYGCTEEEYRTEACCPAFSDVCAGIKRVNELGVPNTVTIIVRSSNAKTIGGYFEVLSGLGVKEIRFGLTTNTGRNLEGAWSLTRDECEQFFLGLDEYRKKYPDMLIHDLKWQVDYDKPPFPVKDTYTIACDAGTQSITISEAGYVRPCNMMPADCFGDHTIDDYKAHIDSGKSLPFDCAIARCVKKYKAMGKTVDCICPRGFA